MLSQIVICRSLLCIEEILTCCILDSLKKLRWNNGIINSVDEHHWLVDAMPIIDARHLGIHLVQALVAQKFSET